MYGFPLCSEAGRLWFCVVLPEHPLQWLCLFPGVFEAVASERCWCRAGTERGAGGCCASHVCAVPTLPMPDLPLPWT